GKVGITSALCCTNQQTNAVIPSGDWNTFFLYCALVAAKPRLLERAPTTAVPIINKGSFEQVLLPRPKRDEQIAIGQAVSVVEGSLDAHREEVDALRRVKSALMSVLLTGEVRVKPDEDAA